MSGRVLVADDDADIAGFLELNLALEGYAVQVVHDGEQALRAALAEPPDLVLLDVMMPGLDGVEVLRRLRSSAATAALPVLLLTARSLSADKVAGLTAGADDYIVKPFDTLELLARVETTLRRTAEARSVSPLTGLPGNSRIESELAARAERGPYAVCHVDLDQFKSFNDAYGFLRGDRLLLALSRCLLTGADGAGDPPAFVGHVGGDDFIVVCTPAQAEPLSRSAVELFDREVGSHYDPADLDRGHVVTPDRRGSLRSVPTVSVSIGVAKDVDGGRDPRAVVASATEMKSWAKTQPGSVVAVDRRG